MAGLVEKENRGLPYLFFPFFLLLSGIVEFIGSRLSATYYNTNLLYNLFSLFEFLFYLLCFVCIFTGQRTKRTLLIIGFFYLALTLLNIFFYQGKDEFHTYTYMLGCILIVVFSAVYFNFLFRFPENNKLTKNPFFWIVTGLLFFYTCSFTLMGLSNFITRKFQYYTNLLFLVQDVLNVLLYTLFSIGCLCKINIRKLLA